MDTTKCWKADSTYSRVTQTLLLTRMSCYRCALPTYVAYPFLALCADCCSIGIPQTHVIARRSFDFKKKWENATPDFWTESGDVLYPTAEDFWSREIVRAGRDISESDRIWLTNQYRARPFGY